MTCRRAEEVDLATVVHDGDAPGWDALRAHYPTCPDCAAEVRAWTEMEQRLRPGEHPSPAALLRFEEASAEASAAERRHVARHLATCAP